jgi:hypothetical protein
MFTECSLAGGVFPRPQRIADCDRLVVELAEQKGASADMALETGASSFFFFFFFFIFYLRVLLLFFIYEYCYYLLFIIIIYYDPLRFL